MQSPPVVPYITAHENEPTLLPPVLRRHGPEGPFLGFVDEASYDRDGWGALWTCQALVPAGRRGRPRLERVHALRQRRAMWDALCQVCGKSLGNEDRYLFLMRDAGRPIGEGERTTSPPVCVPCARISLEACPHLRKGAVAAWVNDFPVWGVAGVTYDPETLEVIPGDDLVDVRYDSEELRWVVAARRIVSLHGVEPVDLGKLHAA
ncbi:hypothetical protein [Streptomyces sp. URMC 125]|uniref:hypothetical protein n=1 Tax=Streptomyces sp. URMC 125 TaxID=3423419 RepID=UPI003F1E45FD